MAKRALPKTEEALGKAYQNCEKKKSFRKVDSGQFQDYVVRSQKDIASADNDFKNGDYYWSRIKAYQPVGSASISGLSLSSFLGKFWIRRKPWCGTGRWVW